MNTLLTAAEKWLNEMSVATESHASALWVNRDDMVREANVWIFADEQGSYDFFLKELKESLNTTKIFWGGKDDTYLYLESF